MSLRAFFLKRLNDHVLYLKKIKLTLDDRGGFCGSDYHLCKLGEWLYGEGNTETEATQFNKMHTLSNTLVSIFLDMDRMVQSSSVEVA